MKLSDAKNLVQEKQRQLESLEISLEDAKAARDELTKQLANARARLKRKKENTKYPTKLAEGFIKSLKSSGVLSSILMKVIDEATEVNTEFERSAYRDALYEVTKDTDIYKMRVSGTGWNIRLTPDVVFEEAAGDLDDWSRGIQEYREDLDVKIKSSRSYLGQKATQFWIEKVFGTGLEVITINARLGYSGRIAPFWRILNSGSQPLSSDRPDNTFNPLPAGPTDFIGDAEREISAEFRRLMEPERELWFREIQLLDEEIKEAQEIRDGFSKNIDKISTEPSKNTFPLRDFEIKEKYVEERELPRAVEQFRADEKSEIPPEEATSENIIKRGARFLGGLLRKAVRFLEGRNDD